MRSDIIKKGFEWAPHRSLLRATGVVKEGDCADLMVLAGRVRASACLLGVLQLGEILNSCHVGEHPRV